LFFSFWGIIFDLEAISWSELRRGRLLVWQMQSEGSNCGSCVAAFNNWLNYGKAACMLMVA
jgi:hypothetical protein